MTYEEAKKMLKAKLECLKRETSGTDIDCNYRNCDECNLCYEQGNMGEQKEALDMAIKALDSWKKYSEKLWQQAYDRGVKDGILFTMDKECEDCISREEVMKLLEKEDWADTVTGVLALPSVTPQSRWFPVSERLPENLGTYLITLENGDVFKCEFNPDYIDEEHDKGAFTYYHDYFDNYTLGLIDSEEIAVDAIAWMPFEPYKEGDTDD